MREALFSSLGPEIAGSRVVDLFAGTGAYGLEAISRDAIKATFYETNREALACLKQNRQAVLKSCNLQETAAEIVARDVYAQQTEYETAEFIFIDPPYATIKSRLGQIFERVDRHSIETTLVVLELPGNLEPKPAGWKLVRRFGKPKRDAPGAAIFERDL